MSKNVLITGGSEGIGKALAYEYAHKNYNIFLIARNYSKLEKIKLEIEKNYKVSCEIYKADVRIQDEVINSINYIKNIYNKIDIAILNAGISEPNWIDDFSIEKFETLYKTNLFGLVYYLKELTNWMNENEGGKIVGISSCADVRGFPGGGVYSSSKSALSTLLESFRVELSNSKIKIITIRPGFIKTPLTDKNKYKMPFLMQPELAAKKIMNAIRKNKRIYTFPKRMYFLSQIIKYTPFFIFKHSIKWRK